MSARAVASAASAALHRFLSPLRPPPPHHPRLCLAGMSLHHVDEDGGALSAPLPNPPDRDGGRHSSTTATLWPGDEAAGGPVDDLFGGGGALWFAVPKKRVTRGKKRMKTTRQKRIKLKENIVVDGRTGELTLMHKLPFNWKDYLPEQPGEVEVVEKEGVEGAVVEEDVDGKMALEAPVDKAQADR